MTLCLVRKIWIVIISLCMDKGRGTGMKRILSVFINRDNAIRIMVTALLAASSQPLIAWSMAGLSGAFLENDLIYAAVFRNILILLLALFIAWFADNSKANLLLDSE